MDVLLNDKNGFPIRAGVKFKFNFLTDLHEQPTNLIGCFVWCDEELRYEIDIFDNPDYTCLSYVSNGIMSQFEIIEPSIPTSEKSQSEVYAFLYNSCIHESSHATVSLHHTIKGAEMAMAFHKEEKRKEHESMYGYLSIDEKSDLYIDFGLSEDWTVCQIKILD